MSISGLRRPQFAQELSKRYAENARWQTLLVVPLASAVALESLKAGGWRR